MSELNRRPIYEYTGFRGFISNITDDDFITEEQKKERVRGKMSH